MQRSFVIGMLGKRGCGKDTVAGLLTERYGFVRLAFADELKKEVAEHYGVSVDLLNDRVLKEVPQVALNPRRNALRKIPVLSLLTTSLFDVLWRAGAKSPRDVMQAWGMMRREQDGADYWVRKIDAHVSSQPGRYVVSDVRLPNERDWVKGLGGVTVRVTRPALEAQRKLEGNDSHYSEIALDDYVADHTLVNHENQIDQLFRDAEAVVAALFPEEVKLPAVR